MAAMRGRPSAFCPEVGQALIDAINEGVPIKHAARRSGVGVRTVYDWLGRARRGEADAELVEWADRFTRLLDRHREAKRQERSRRDREAAKARWRRFKAARVTWWRNKLGEDEFWRRRRLWLAARGRGG
jgi:transposase